MINRKNTIAALLLGAGTVGAQFLMNPEVAFASVGTISYSFASPGSAAGTTKISLPSTSDTYKYEVFSSPQSTPASLPVGTTAYTSGHDISGVDPTTNKYVDIYEVNGSSLVKFKEITLAPTNIRAPEITGLGSANIGPGTVAGSVYIDSLTPNISGDTFKELPSAYQLRYLPVTGSFAPGKAYTLGHDITGVDANRMKYINLYELDSSNKVAAFSQVPLTPSEIAAPSVGRVLLRPGTTAGTTKATLPLIPSVEQSVYSYVYTETSSAPTLPITGDTVTSPTAYTSGSDIGIAADQYLNIYEVYSTNHIAELTSTQVAATNIGAPAITSASGATVAAGPIAGSTVITGLTPNTPGDTFKVQISSRQLPFLPAAGGNAFGVPYEVGTVMDGVDATRNKYVNIFEVNSTGKVVALSTLTLTAGEITAPTIAGGIPMPGTAAGTTKVNLPRLASGYSYQYQLVGTPTTVPLTGGTVSGATTYSSGNITVSNGDYFLDLYELDGSNKIVAFKETPLTWRNIK